ncbi:hypothetical protein, partial [Microbacterium aurantiacum]|uniref:hypothetical protein n=1 Tax=Microbacterium aurantiacum TaxID=162393 RepID=UPI000C7FAA93
MADRDKDGGDRTLVPGAHRVIRMLEAQEGPFAGALVSRGSGVAVQIDAAALSGWDGWAYGGAEHVAGPLDVVRRPDGHDVLLPWCSERLTAFLGRRAAAGVAVTAGETATLVGSLLRGVDELDGGADVRGGWWLTDEGRPVFVLGEGESARESAARIVARLRESTTDRALARTLTGVQQGLDQPRVPRRVQDDWERELFENAAPRPLRREVFAPERARDIVPQRAVFEDATDAAPDRSLAAVVQVVRRWVRGRWSALSALRPEASQRSSKQTGSGSAVPRPARQRRRALIVAGAAAAAVLAVGLLWPTGGASEAGAQTDGGSDAGTPPSEEQTSPAQEPAASATPDEPTASSGETDGPPTAEGSDPVYAATALLAVIRACAEAEDAACTAAVAEGAVGVVERLGAVGTDRELALVDEYGDVAVIRVTPAGSAHEEGEQRAAASESMLVLVRLDENWLVRDVYDV